MHTTRVSARISGRSVPDVLHVESLDLLFNRKTSMDVVVFYAKTAILFRLIILFDIILLYNKMSVLRDGGLAWEGISLESSTKYI
jgi:hypothetical protein